MILTCYGRTVKRAGHRRRWLIAACILMIADSVWLGVNADTLLSQITCGSFLGLWCVKLMREFGRESLLAGALPVAEVWAD